MLSPLLYSLFTHNCVAAHNSNTIIKFADNTMMVGLITIDDETANREEVSDLAEWCQDNNLSLKVSKTKVLIVDYRKQSAEHAPMHIDRAVVERVESITLLSVHINKELKWSTHTNTVMKKTRHHLFPLRSLKNVGMDRQILKKFYRCTIESILTGCIITWYGNCLASDDEVVRRVEPMGK